MKLKVLKGPKLGAIISYELVDRHRAAAPSVSNHEKKLYHFHRHKAGANPIVTH